MSGSVDTLPLSTVIDQKIQTCFQSCFGLVFFSNPTNNKSKMSTLSDSTPLKLSKQEDTRTWTIAKIFGVILGVGAVLILYVASLQANPSAANSVQSSCMSPILVLGIHV